VFAVAGEQRQAMIECGGGVHTPQAVPVILDGDEEIAEYDAAGTVLRCYLTGPAVDDRIARAEGSSLSNPTKYYYYTNHQGSVIDMTDAAAQLQKSWRTTNTATAQYRRWPPPASRSGLMGDLKKALAERMLNAEMEVHLASEADDGLDNHRNGSSSKTPEGSMELSIPRDRHGRFDPALIRKYCRRFPGFDDKIIALYANGISTRDIQGHIRGLYGIEISPDLVSAVTDSVLDEVTTWQGPIDFKKLRNGLPSGGACQP
jgi:hypothetical protein